MSINDMDSKIKELRELRRMADELAVEMESITDSIKRHMDAEGVDTLNGTDWKVTYMVSGMSLAATHWRILQWVVSAVGPEVWSVC